LYYTKAVVVKRWS